MAPVYHRSYLTTIPKRPDTRGRVFGSTSTARCPALGFTVLAFAPVESPVATHTATHMRR